jgi:2-polyprenyl-3-methyl-5-hydroxy-6-metoxy-1,4-benzoquinol methylase
MPSEPNSLLTQAGPAGSARQLTYETLNAYQRTAALKAAIELDLFTAIGEGTNTARSLAKCRQATERGVRILCDFLVAIEILTKQDEQYSLTEESARLLDRRSPACIASAAGFLTLPEVVNSFKDLAGVVRNGLPDMAGEGTVEPQNAIWVDFARSMGPLQAPTAETIATVLHSGAGESWKVLDVAAGHGVFGIAVARQNPNAEIFAVDWPAVLEVARGNARQAGVEARYHGVPGSAFEVDFGRGYDVILLTGFLHHFGSAAIETLLRKLRAALAQNGRVVALEFVPNEDRVTPPETAAWAINMLAMTRSGDAYTFAEYERMFRSAGFSSNELVRLPSNPQSVILSRE